MLDDLRLPPDEFHPDGLEYYGGLSSLKAGLVTADRITTVSPTYAAELMRPEFGMGLQGVIAARAAVVSGILNGVDTDVWSPEREAIPFTATAMKGKAAVAGGAVRGIRVAGAGAAGDCGQPVDRPEGHRPFARRHPGIRRERAAG